MNVNAFTGFLKMIGLLLVANITGILFLGGLAVICYAVFLQSIVGGYIATGTSLIAVAMILSAERARR